MRAMGVTCAEIKTGYRLDTRTELKQISVIDQLKRRKKCTSSALLWDYTPCRAA